MPLINKEKGIAIKRVTISGVSNAQALHTKKDHFGYEILDENRTFKFIKGPIFSNII